MPPNAQHLEALSRAQILETPLADLADMTMDAIELRTAGRATLERLFTLSKPRIVR